MLTSTRRLFLILLCMTTVSPACSEAPSPEFVARRFFGALQARSRPAMRSLYDNVLSARTKAALAAKAESLTRETGVNVAPWDVVVFRGLTRGDRVSKRTVEQLTETQARVRVEFEWYVPVAGERARPAPAPVELRLVLEEGQWRVDLPELVSNEVERGGP